MHLRGRSHGLEVSQAPLLHGVELGRERKCRGERYRKEREVHCGCEGCEVYLTKIGARGTHFPEGVDSKNYHGDCSGRFAYASSIVLLPPLVSVEE